MYDWIADALQDSGVIVTANRRLARVLKAEYGIQQKSSGSKAWASPEIHAWQDWMHSLSSNASRQALLPTRINSHQSQWLWEKCWRQELGDQSANYNNLVRQSRDAWQRLADWRLGLTHITRSAQNDSQRMFAAVAARYDGLLKRGKLVDDAGMADLLLALIDDKRIELQRQYTFAGFDRQRPIATRIQDAMSSAGATVCHAPAAAFESASQLQVFENSDAEFRAAGAWARRCFEENPGSRIAIVASKLEANTDSIARCVREGVAPGWQHGPRALFEAVNVSYGRRLSDYPAICIALTLLRWLVNTIPSRDVSLLLHSPLLGSGDIAGRSRLELSLRKMPDRAWLPSMLTSEFRGGQDDLDAADWLKRLAAFTKRRHELPRSASPGQWALLLDEILTEFGWPGDATLDSDEFQLINRWRELLNEFARLTLVVPDMSPRLALARLELMAGDTIFQPESAAALVHLMGPLEASGAEFDALWITGLNATNWPPAGVPAVLISRRLQQEHGMPDSSPDDTATYADKVLSRLLQSAQRVQCSFSTSDDDIEQTATDLLPNHLRNSAVTGSDPGWYAAILNRSVRTHVVSDAVPAVEAGEQISGGAAAIQNQFNDPVTAFVVNRMSARRIHPQAVGIPAPMRGNLIHDALYKLYVDLPSSDDIAAWQGEELKSRIDEALSHAFFRHKKNADTVLQQLLALEHVRLGRLLQQFIAVDSGRGAFSVASVESDNEFVNGHIRLTLRSDRTDQFEDGTCAIIDYKSGAKKRLLNRVGEVQEFQLFVYAAATSMPVSALLLVNVDSREINLDGVGRGFTSVEEWPGLLQRVEQQIAQACVEISTGDVRININQGLQNARPLNVLTRYTELRRDLR
ncbi:MAG TPA: PD-(D/E)XK nuclease family protein [Woeseiaceae bacterium]|nr:PD-(D/E)XK nuclease family protein [Woeseiaceae bacterium]